MKQKKKIKLWMGIIWSAFLMTAGSAYAIDTPQHISDNILNGFQGIETTNFGELGYNYAITTPDFERDLIFGFSPDMASPNSRYTEIFGLGDGWGLKIPFLEQVNGQWILHEDRGLEYPAQYQEETDTFEILHYPSEYTFSRQDEDTYLLEKGYGEQISFAVDGRVLQTTDALGNITVYEYDKAGQLSRMIFSDGTEVRWDRTSDEMILTYLKPDAQTEVLAVFVLARTADGRSILTEIRSEFAENMVFQYESSAIQGNLRLESAEIQDNVVYTFYYEESQPVENGTLNRIAEIQIDREDGILSRRQYTYGADGRIAELDTGSLTISYSYDINTDGTLTVQTCKESSESIDILEDVYNDKGQLIHYETNDATVSLEYNQKNKISKMIENGVQTKYTYSKNGLLDTANQDGLVTKYSYYDDGTRRTVQTNTEVIYYNQDGSIQEVKQNKDTFPTKNSDFTRDRLMQSNDSLEPLSPRSDNIDLSRIITE